MFFWREWERKFNKQDVYGKVLIDPELGIATDYLDTEHRVKASTIKKMCCAGRWSWTVWERSCACFMLP